MDVSICPRCEVKAVSLRSLIRHIGIRHAHERDLSITCGMHGCQSSYRLFHSFKRHVYRFHRDVVLQQSNADCLQSSEKNNSGMDDIDGLLTRVVNNRFLTLIL